MNSITSYSLLVKKHENNPIEISLSTDSFFVIAIDCTQKSVDEIVRLLDGNLEAVDIESGSGDKRFCMTRVANGFIECIFYSCSVAAHYVFMMSKEIQNGLKNAIQIYQETPAEVQDEDPLEKVNNRRDDLLREIFG